MKKISALIAVILVALGIGLSASGANAAGQVLTNSGSSATLIYWQAPVSTTSYALNPGASTAYIGSKTVSKFLIPSTCRGYASDAFGVDRVLAGGTWYGMNLFSGNVVVRVTGCG